MIWLQASKRNYVVYYKVVFGNYETVYGYGEVNIEKAKPSPKFIPSITRQYNGFEIEDPQVVTDSNSEIEFVYYEYIDGVKTLLTYKPFNAGKYAVEIKLLENRNYKSMTITKDFEITPQEVDLIWYNTELQYNGKYQVPTAYINERTYDKVNVSISVLDNLPSIACGKYVAVATLDNRNYTIANGTDMQEYTIITRTVIIPEDIVTSYTGHDIIAVSSDYFTYEVVSDTVEVVKYAGTYIIRLVLNDKSNYVWEDGSSDDEMIIVTVNKVDLSTADIVVEDIESQNYTKYEITPKPVVYYNGLLLAEGVDYELTYTNNINPYMGGDYAIVTITGINNFEGSYDKEFVIASKVLAVTAKYDKVQFVVVTNGNQFEVEDEHLTYDKDIKVLLTNIPSQVTVEELYEYFESNQRDRIKIYNHKGYIIDQSMIANIYVGTGYVDQLHYLFHHVI